MGTQTIMAGSLTSEEIELALRRLSDTLDALVEATASLARPQWDFKPSPDRWSIAETVEHIVLIENRIHAIVGRMSDAPPAAPGWEPAPVDELILTEVPNRTNRIQAPEVACPTNRWTGEEALNRFLEARRQTIDLVSTAPSLRGRVLPHPIFGPWDGYHWLLATAGHCERHIEQIDEVKAESEFPAA